MSERFSKPDQAKQERILQAALLEFAQKEFANASTNNIVKSAQISKGLLFRYFGSKKELYLYLYEYVRGVMDAEIYAQAETHSGSLPELLTHLGRQKLAVAGRHPDMAAFILRTKHENSPEVFPGLEEVDKKRAAHWKDEYLFGQVNMAALKPEFRNTLAVNLIRFALDGCVESLRVGSGGHGIPEADIDALLANYEKYVEIIKLAFFNPEPK
jgi:AcrR family transcriptional regulator